MSKTKLKRKNDLNKLVPAFNLLENVELLLLLSLFKSYGVE